MSRILSLSTILIITTAFIASANAETVQEYVAQGQQAYEQADYQTSINLLEKAVEVDPNFAPAYNALGLVYQAMGKQGEEVVWFFKVAIDIDPGYVDAFGNLCRAYYQFQEYDSALEACQKTLELNPDYGPAQVHMGWTYLIGKSNPTEALRYFDIVRKKVESPTIFYGMGLAYSMQGNNAMVLEMVTTLRSLGSNDYASQLEQEIRKANAPPEPVAPAENPSTPSQQPGKVVQSQPNVSPAYPKIDDSTPVSGQMRIRLRGRMQGDSTEGSSSSPNKKHPGSL